MKKDGDFIEQLRQIFVTIDVFNLTNQTTEKRVSTLEKIIYSVISAIGFAVLGAWLSFVIRKP